MKVKAIFGNDALACTFLKALGGDMADGATDLMVVVRRWDGGGTDDVAGAVGKALLESPEPPVVVAVLGDRDPEGERLRSELLVLGVPEECLLFREGGGPVRLSGVVSFARAAWEKGLRADPVIWDGPSDPAIWENAKGSAAGKPPEVRLPADPLDAREPARAGMPAGDGAKIAWFISPVAGSGQTTLASSLVAMLASSVGERAVLLDLCRPPQAHLSFGDPEFEDAGDFLRADTPWGTVCVPKPGTWDGNDAGRAIKMAEKLAAEYDRVVVDAPAGWKLDVSPVVTVVSEEREHIIALKKAEAGDVLVLNRVRDQGAEYLQRVMEKELGRRADAVVPYDPESRKAVGTPQALVSDDISRAAGEILARLAG